MIILNLSIFVAGLKEVHSFCEGHTRSGNDGGGGGRCCRLCCSPYGRIGFVWASLMEQSECTNAPPFDFVELAEIQNTGPGQPRCFCKLHKRHATNAPMFLCSQQKRTRHEGMTFENNSTNNNKKNCSSC